MGKSKNCKKGAQRCHFQKFSSGASYTLNNWLWVVTQFYKSMLFMKKICTATHTIKLGLPWSTKLGFHNCTFHKILSTDVSAFYLQCPAFFFQGRLFLSNTIYFSHACATLRCSKFVIFVHFLVLSNQNTKKGAQRCHIFVRKG